MSSKRRLPGRLKLLIDFMCRLPIGGAHDAKDRKRLALPFTFDQEHEINIIEDDKVGPTQPVRLHAFVVCDGAGKAFCDIARECDRLSCAKSVLRQSVLYSSDIRLEQNVGNFLSPAFRKRVQDEVAQPGKGALLTLGRWHLKLSDQL
jgi:hypothetical protein